MSRDELAALMARKGWGEAEIGKIAGISDRNARALVAGEKHVPESVARLLLIVAGEARPEDYRP